MPRWAGDCVAGVGPKSFPGENNKAILFNFPVATSPQFRFHNLKILLHAFAQHIKWILRVNHRKVVIAGFIKEKQFHACTSIGRVEVLVFPRPQINALTPSHSAPHSQETP